VRHNANHFIRKLIFDRRAYSYRHKKLVCFSFPREIFSEFRQHNRTRRHAS